MKEDDFAITKEEVPGGVKFILKGRLNSASADELQFKLDKAISEEQINIVINMSRVEYMSSAGIRVILKSYKDAKKAGGKLGIERPSENVKNVLGMTALDEMLIR